MEPGEPRVGVTTPRQEAGLTAWPVPLLLIHPALERGNSNPHASRIIPGIFVPDIRFLYDFEDYRLRCYLVFQMVHTVRVALNTTAGLNIGVVRWGRNIR